MQTLEMWQPKTSVRGRRTFSWECPECTKTNEKFISAYQALPVVIQCVNCKVHFQLVNKIKISEKYHYRVYNQQHEVEVRYNAKWECPECGTTNTNFKLTLQLNCAMCERVFQSSSGVGPMEETSTVRLKEI